MKAIRNLTASRLKIKDGKYRIPPGKAVELHEGDESDFNVKAAVRRGWAAIEDTDDIYVPVEASTSAPAINWEVEVVTAENPFPELDKAPDAAIVPKQVAEEEPVQEKPRTRTKKS